MKLNVIIAILAITLLETIALVNCINGITLAASLAIIGGLGGYQVGKFRRGNSQDKG